MVVKCAIGLVSEEAIASLEIEAVEVIGYRAVNELLDGARSYLYVSSGAGEWAVDIRIIGVDYLCTTARVSVDRLSGDGGRAATMPT